MCVYAMSVCYNVRMNGMQDEDACLVGCEVYEDVMMSLKNGK